MHFQRGNAGKPLIAMREEEGILSCFWKVVYVIDFLPGFEVPIEKSLDTGHFLLGGMEVFLNANNAGNI